MDNQTFKKRLKGVRKALSALKADCLILTKPANATYLTGFTGHDSWAIVLPKLVMLVTDSRYTEQAADQCRFCRIIERTDSMAQAVADLLKKQRAVKLAAIEQTTSIAAFEGLKKHIACRLNSAIDIVESIRRTKDNEEVHAIRAAGEIAGRVFSKLRTTVRRGMTENELAGFVDFEIRKLGGQSCFETIVAFGADSSRPHHQPGAKKLKKNDAVLVDFGVRYQGYCCDVTRCFSMGTKNRFFERVYAAVEQAQAAALDVIKAGVEIKKVDMAAREVIKKHKLPLYGHGTGHGLGLEVHELPVVSNNIKGRLQAGDVITIEPAVYVPGRLGVRIEDDILVTDDGYVLLTAEV